MAKINATVDKEDILVAAPLGIAHRVGESTDGKSWLIRYSKRDFTESTWASYFPAGGLFCYREIPKEQITELK